MRVSFGPLAVLAAGIRFSATAVGRPGLIFVVRRMALERRPVDIAFLLVTGREGPLSKALAWRFAASLAVAHGFVLARRLAGFPRLRHALKTPRRCKSFNRLRPSSRWCVQDFFFRDRRLPFRFGTFLPLRRASERPMAIACLRLFTFLPLRPLRSLPDLRFFIALRTSLPADFEYFRAIKTSSLLFLPGRVNVRCVVSFQLQSGDRILAAHQLPAQQQIDPKCGGEKRADRLALDVQAAGIGTEGGQQDPPLVMDEACTAQTLAADIDVRFRMIMAADLAKSIGFSLMPHDQPGEP